MTARILSEQEISRKAFLKGGGALVVGLSLAGAAQSAHAANNPTATFSRHSGATPEPTDPNQIDSYLEINPDNTATLYTGWVELGQGTPTALRMIAAEELNMSFAQVKLAQVDTNVSLSAASVASSSTSTAMRPTSLRGATAAARQILLGLASAQLGVPAGNLTVQDGVVSGGGKSIPLTSRDRRAFIPVLSPAGRRVLRVQLEPFRASRRREVLGRRTAGENALRA
jgi:nicotinate dehydrogenase subunit B